MYNGFFNKERSLKCVLCINVICSSEHVKTSGNGGLFVESVQFH